MAGRGPQSFKKRQKEQLRKHRGQAKSEGRGASSHSFWLQSCCWPSGIKLV